MKNFQAMTEEEQFQMLAEHARRTSEELAHLQETSPDLPFTTAIVMAGDLANAKQVDEALKTGQISIKDAKVLIGSYARFGWWLKHMKAGDISEREFFRNLPELWTSSDPDDMSEEYYAVWFTAFQKNKRRIITDGKPFPKTVSNTVTVYRGQRTQDPFGFSWTIDRGVAEKFARGASFRTRINGIVFRAEIEKRYILAYLTGRGESEVIVSRNHLSNIRPT